MSLRRFFSVVLTAIIFASLIGCSGSGSLEKANEAYDLYQFNTAIDMYKKLISKERDKKLKGEMTMKIGHSYRQMGEYKKAENYYERAQKYLKGDPDALFYEADMQKRQEKYEDAIITYNEYIRENPGDPKGEIGKKSCEDAIKWQNEKTRYVVENFKILNSKSNDFAPMYYKKGAMVITSDRDASTGNRLYNWTNQKHTDIYVSNIVGKRGSKKLDKPQLIDEDNIVNTKYNEGVVTFNRRFNTMYYTQCNDKNGEGHNCRIFVIRKRGKVWGEPDVLPFCSDSFVKYGHPSLSSDGKKLYFTSDDPDLGFGGKDIYVTSYVRRGKTWSDPVNLGKNVNTEKDEMYPFSYTSKRLYFASDGHPGMGGLDIFYTEKQEDGSWSVPVNMKHPINSGGDDFGIIVEKGGTVARGYRGFISSNRGGKGDDIYEFYMTPLEYTLSGTVFDIKTKETIPDAKVTLYVSEEDTSYTMVAQSDASGGYKFQLKPEVEYSVLANKKYYFDSEEKFVSTVGLEFSEDFVRDLYLDPFLPVDVELEGIYYDLDDDQLRSESMVVLDSLYNLLMKHPYVVIEIGSHTDCRATDEYNKDLSQRRAKSVTDYLEYKGIPMDRLQPIGYGESKLANTCDCSTGSPPNYNCTEEQHQQNRRTTFRIIRTDYQYGEDQMKQLEDWRKEREKLKGPPPGTTRKTQEEEEEEAYEEEPYEETE
jgi:peptidoglycan-associated lipoprotein